MAREVEAAERRHSVWSCSLHRRILLIAALTLLAFSHTTSWAAVPQGVWLMDARVAVQIYSCAGLLCGRILWLQIPPDPQGQLDRDKNNPDPALQHRRLCGLTVLWDLRPSGPKRWGGGWFYNPKNGGHTTSQPSSNPPTCSLRASIWEFRFSARPRP